MTFDESNDESNDKSDENETAIGRPQNARIRGGGFGSTAYSGAATFGRVYTMIGAIIGVIIAIILIFAGVSKLHDPHTETARAVVSKVLSCERQTRGNSPMFFCVADATYTVGTKTYTAANLSINKEVPLQIGTAVTLRYIPGKPADAIYELSPKSAGKLLIGLGVLIGGITTGVAIVAQKSKSFAAISGTMSAIGMIAH